MILICFPPGTFCASGNVSYLSQSGQVSILVAAKKELAHGPVCLELVYRDSVAGPATLLRMPEYKLMGLTAAICALQYL